MADASGTTLRNQAPVQVAAGMQGNGVLPCFRPIAGSQRIVLPEPMVERQLVSQEAARRTELRIDLQRVQRPLPLKSQQATQMPLAAAPIEHTGSSRLCRSNEGLDLTSLAARYLPGPVRSMLGKRLRTALRHRCQRRHFGKFRQVLGKQCQSGIAVIIQRSGRLIGQSQQAGRQRRLFRTPRRPRFTERLCVPERVKGLKHCRQARPAFGQETQCRAARRSRRR